MHQRVVNRGRDVRLYVYVCIYGEHFQHSIDWPGMVVNPARGQLRRENVFFPVLPVRV